MGGICLAFASNPPICVLINPSDIVNLMLFFLFIRKITPENARKTSICKYVTKVTFKHSRYHHFRKRDGLISRQLIKELFIH